MSGDELFAVIVCKHYDPLFRFALSLTHTETEAGDLTQQTFYVWAKKGEQLRDISKVKSWLFTTLHRLFLETRRRQIRFPHDNLDEVPEQLSTESTSFADRLDASTVLSALAMIHEVYRAAVALFYLEDCSYKEIALILEIPVGTVRSRIARGIRQLRAILLPGTSLQFGRGAELQHSRCGTSSLRAPLTPNDDLSLSM
jgi:RNA polymerase sigma-70 factor (ECF subfamily)